MKNKGQNGQVLLIVILTMIIALTVGLSLAARIVTELKLSKQNEESQRAFQAAESGIKQTLEKGADINLVTLGNNSNFSTSYGAVEGGSIVLNNGIEVDQIGGADVWLSKYATDGTIFEQPMGGGANVPVTIYWGSSNQNCSQSAGNDVASAIEIVLLYGIDKTKPEIQKIVFDPCRNRTNGANENASIGTYNVTDSGGNSYSFNYRANLVILANPRIMKVIPIYNSTIVGLVSATVFPRQGASVESTGKSGDTVRKVQYFQSYPQMPIEVFPYSIISQ